MHLVSFTSSCHPLSFYQPQCRTSRVNTTTARILLDVAVSITKYTILRVCENVLNANPRTIAPLLLFIVWRDAWRYRKKSDQLASTIEAIFVNDTFGDFLELFMRTENICNDNRSLSIVVAIWDINIKLIARSSRDRNLHMPINTPILIIAGNSYEEHLF